MKDAIAEFTLLLQMTAAAGQGLITPLAAWLHWSPEAVAVAHAGLGIVTVWQALIAKAHLPKEQQVEAAKLAEILEQWRAERGKAPAQTMTVSVDTTAPKAE